MINLMTEISKEVKLMFYIDIVVGLIYAFQYLVIPDILYSGEPYYNAHLTRLWGGTIVIFIIAGIISLKRADWETLKPVWEVLILWFVMIVILSFAAFAYFPFTPVGLARHVIDTIATTILTVVNIIIYYRAIK